MPVHLAPPTVTCVVLALGERIIVSALTAKPEDPQLNPELRHLQAEVTRLEHEVDRLRVQREELRRDNRRLSASLDAYLQDEDAGWPRAPVEMTAGTCVGPRGYQVHPNQGKRAR